MGHPDVYHRLVFASALNSSHRWLSLGSSALRATVSNSTCISSKLKQASRRLAISGCNGTMQVCPSGRTSLNPASFPNPPSDSRYQLGLLILQLVVTRFQGIHQVIGQIFRHRDDQAHTVIPRIARHTQARGIFHKFIAQIRHQRKYIPSWCRFPFKLPDP